MDKLNNNQFSQNAISHKQLNDFLIKAKKDISSIESTKNNKIQSISSKDIYDIGRIKKLAKQPNGV